MGNITHYINKYGNLTFGELAFNEIDNVILSTIAYINFDSIIEKNKTIRLEEAAKSYFKKNNKKDVLKNVLCVQIASKILKYVAEERRFKDLVLSNYDYKSSGDYQFSALFIDLDEKTTYIAFEGTDDLISGWKEDMALSYEFPVIAQKEAISYINSKISWTSKRNYILGGHSKGGNLALVAGMYANPFIRKKIIQIISNDGPGLREKQINSRQFKRVKHLYELVVPNYSVVGLLLNQPENPRVISSTKTGIMAHNVLTWEVLDNHFIDAKLSKFSKNVDKIITQWISSYSDEEKKELVMQIFSIFNRAKIKSLLDIKASKIPSVIRIVKESTKLDKNSKKAINDLINLTIDHFKDDVKSHIKI